MYVACASTNCSSGTPTTRTENMTSPKIVDFARLPVEYLFKDVINLSDEAVYRLDSPDGRAIVEKLQGPVRLEAILYLERGPSSLASS